MRHRRTQGFTLIELLIVIAIIGILAAILIPNLMRARAVAVDRAAQGYTHNILTAANAYLAENVNLSNTSMLGTSATIGTAQGCYSNFSVAQPSATIAFGSYTVPDPSFTVTSCNIEPLAGGNIGVSVVYTGGTKTSSSLNWP